MEAQLDLLGTPLVAPTGKLDADQYMADDIDGITESLFGSGNLNFLSLQAAQTDSLLAAAPSSKPVLSHDTGDRGLGFQNDGSQIATTSNAMGDGMETSLRPYGDDSATDIDQSGLHTNTVEPLNLSSGENNITVASTSASNIRPADIAEDGTSFSGRDGTNGTNGTNGTTQIITSGRDGRDGNNGRDGTDGNDGDDGGGDDCHDCCGCDGDIININIDLGDILTTINNTLTITSDIVNNLVNNVTNIVTSITDILDITEILNCLDIGDILNLTEIINNVTTFVDNTATNITSIVNNLLGDVFCGDGLNLNLDFDVLDTVLGGLDLSITDTITGVLNAGLDLAPVTNLLNDITGLDLPILADLDITGLLNIDPENILLNLGDLNNPGALIETVTNIIDPSVLLDVADTSEILDVVSGLVNDGPLGELPVVGDLVDNVLQLADTLLDPADQVISVAQDLLEQPLDTVQELLNEPQEFITDLGGSLLNALNLGDGDMGVGDTDLTLDLGIIDEIEIPLDPLEAVLGDIDLDLGLDTVTNLLPDLGLGGGGADPGDTDISLNLEQLDLGLDNIGLDNIGLGDLGLDDLGLGELGLGDGGLDIPLDPVEAIAGDIDLGLDLFAPDNSASDTDLTIDLGIADEIEIPLDIVESVLGDIDIGLNIDVGNALELLSPLSGGSEPIELLDSATDILGTLTNWTESTIPESGGLFDDIISGIGGQADLLPEPITSIAEGLGSLQIDDHHVGSVLGKLGGLFG